MKSKWAGIALTSVLLSAGGATADMELPGYTLSRLPISLARQLLDTNGNPRLIVPSFVSDGGIMGGMRFTWQPKPLSAGGTVGLVSESGYLYDLNSKTYIAQQIANHVVSYVGDDQYIGKRLHPNGQYWQTLRCDIDGLVKRASSDIYDNPSCTVIDNDFLDQTPAGGQALPNEYWPAIYISSNIIGSAGLSYTATNRHASSMVADLPDDSDGFGDSANLYHSDNSMQAFDAAFQSLISYPADANNPVLGALNGKDVAWVWVTGAGPVPDELYQFTYEGSGVYQTTTITLTALDDNGDYARVLGFSKDGDVVTNIGRCHFSSGCVTMDVFDDPIALDAYSPALLNNGVWLGSTLAGVPGGPGAIDVRSSTPAFYNLIEIIHDRFGETVATAPSYYFPGYPSSNSTINMNWAASESGKYIVVAAKDENGNDRVYLFEEQ
ncbi:hypothetical protein A167_01973 [Alcanivorax sp. S71-1-4]|uniref:hypothetical protein n=1 Tax=Alcanivorax sp. S71-1-4 TaxID=1177159 RepID=UPI001358C5A1|nr:hypothetical protein [Alcanivorax sp. S71-1-4]KAF0809212.1 hypothetical protein A167_01973 [Alcanivorax sp. S71-1-4]